MSFIRLIYRGEFEFDFTRAWRYGLIASAVLVLISLGSLATRQLQLGIDFEGGASWEVPSQDLSVEATRDALRPLGQANARIQVVTNAEGDRAVSVRADVDAVDRTREITRALADAAGLTPDDIAVNSVGPTWGDEITEKAVRALIFFFIAIAIYITVRLEWKMAVGSLVGVVHDIIVTVGFYSVFGLEVTPATVIAFLTILGYSLYDGIIVFDRARENSTRLGSAGKLTYAGVMNLSLNQMLMRSVNTILATLLPIASLLVVGSLVLGATTLQEFGVALLVGLAAGAYSSFFVAAPVVVRLKEREPRSQAARRRAERAGEVPEKAGAGPARPAKRAAAATGTTTRPAPATAVPPRPRKKKRRR